MYFFDDKHTLFPSYTTKNAQIHSQQDISHLRQNQGVLKSFAFHYLGDPYGTQLCSVTLLLYTLNNYLRGKKKQKKN